MSTVPSNLIPTRITQLTEDPTPSASGYLVYVRDGVTYKVQASSIVSVSGVPTTRQVIAGTGMSGGGALSSNVTLSIAAGGVGTTQLATSGVTAGVYGDATNVPQVTVDATGRVTAATSVPVAVSGYVPTSRQVIAGTGLTGGGALTGDVTLTASLSSATPESVNTTGSAGVSTSMSRADHKHPAIDLAVDAQVDGLLGLSNGGTGRSITATPGGVIWSGADGLYASPVGTAGQVLVSAGTSSPTWGSALIVADQSANVVYAGPASGPDAPTGFRALVNADLPASGAVAATYGSATQAAVVVVNSKGVVTSASSVTVTPAYSSLTGAVPTWNQDTTGSSASCTGNAATATSATTATNLAAGGLGQIPYQSAAGTTAMLLAGTAGQVLTSNGTAAPTWATASGGVTSVTATSPVASSGGATPVISLDAAYGDTTNPYASKTANYILAAPNGTAGTPTFRAIVAADVPTLNQNTTGSAGSCTGNAATITGQANSATITADTANTASTIVLRDASGNFSAGTITATLTGIASGNLVSGGALGTPSSGTLTNCTFPTLNQNTTGSSASCTGNAATVTNGVVTTGSYADPAWVTSLAGSKITGQLTNGISGGTF